MWLITKVADNNGSNSRGLALGPGWGPPIKSARLLPAMTVGKIRCATVAKLPSKFGKIGCDALKSKPLVQTDTATLQPSGSLNAPDDSLLQPSGIPHVLDDCCYSMKPEFNCSAVWSPRRDPMLAEAIILPSSRTGASMYADHVTHSPAELECLEMMHVSFESQNCCSPALDPMQHELLLFDAGSQVGAIEIVSPRSPLGRELHRCQDRLAHSESLTGDLETPSRSLVAPSCEAFDAQMHDTLLLPSTISVQSLEAVRFDDAPQLSLQSSPHSTLAACSVPQVVSPPRLSVADFKHIVCRVASPGGLCATPPPRKAHTPQLTP